MRRQFKKQALEKLSNEELKQITLDVLREEHRDGIYWPVLAVESEKDYETARPFMIYYLTTLGREVNKTRAIDLYIVCRYNCNREV